MIYGDEWCIELGEATDRRSFTSAPSGIGHRSVAVPVVSSWHASSRLASPANYCTARAGRTVNERYDCDSANQLSHRGPPRSRGLFSVSGCSVAYGRCWMKHARLIRANARQRIVMDIVHPANTWTGISSSPRQSSRLIQSVNTRWLTAK